MYKIETHLHTSHVSRCGQLNAAQIVSAYKEAGYSAVIVTDHYSRITFDHLKINLYDDSDKLSPFLAGYRYLLEEGAKVGLEVYRGAEVRFDECNNDYLVYGYHDILTVLKWITEIPGMTAIMTGHGIMRMSTD